MNIDAFQLPALLRTNLSDGDYRLSPAQVVLLRTILNRIHNPDPKLYSYNTILSANRLWTSKYFHCYLGTKNLQYFPGDADPKLTLIIGESEPDSPIALDYRTAEPRVIYLCEITHVSYWVELSPSYAALMKAIGPRA